MSCIPVILNPTAGGGRLLRGRPDLEKAAAEAGRELEFWTTHGPGHATELASRAASENRPLVLAFGGDGTYNEVARGLIGTRSALGALPGGTTSVLAYEFAIPRPAARAVRVLLEGTDVAMRVARTDRGEIGLLMVSAGPDSHVLQRLRPSLKRLGGRVGVALQGVVEAVAGGSLPRMRVVTSEGTLEVGWTIVSKSRCYGGPFAAAPGADPLRADLEVVAQVGSGRRAAVSFLLGIPTGRHIRRADVVVARTGSVRLEPADPSRPVAYQVDGDVAGWLPVEISVDPRALLVRVPGARGI